MNAKEYAICEICDKAVKARGIGAHKRLKHGIVERIVYTIPDLSTQVDSSTQVADLCTKVDDLSTKVDDLSDDMSQVIDMQTHNLSNLSVDSSTQVPNLSTKVRRPSGFVLKGSVGEKQVFKTSDQINSLRETITVQSKVIHDQSSFIESTLPAYLFDPRYHAEKERIDKLPTQTEKDKAEKDIVEKLSAKTGKDLTECKRPDGKHNYTDRDLLILIARLTRETIRWQSGHIMDIMVGYQNYDNAIKLFENIFDCKFDDVKKANPNFVIGKTDGDLIQQYANLEYSKPYQWKH